MIPARGWRKSEADYFIGLKLYYNDGMLMEMQEVKLLGGNEHLLRSLSDAVFVGWLPKEEVAELERASPKKDDWCKEPCYWTFLDRSTAREEDINELNPMYKFWNMLEEELEVSLFGESDV